MAVIISFLLLLFTFLVSRNARAQQTLFPPAIPLAVRSPYLSTWQYLTNGTIIGRTWPTTFNGSSVCRLLYLAGHEISFSLFQVLGWAVFVRVDGLSYSFLGDEGLVPGGPLNDSVNLTNIVVTPTQTVVTAQAGPMQVNLTFLIPIEVRFQSSVTFTFLHMHHLKPGDWVKQSIPFSYMSFTAKSLDGASHAVQVYSDITGGTCSRSPKPAFSPASTQSGAQEIELRRFSGARRPMPISSTTASTSRFRQFSTRSSTKRIGVRCITRCRP